MIDPLSVNDATLLTMPEADFEQLVRDTYDAQREHQLQTLAKSPLAYCSLVEPCFLTGDNITPALRRMALQSVLRWAVNKLRPGGSHAWQDWAWQDYNIIFYYYLDSTRQDNADEGIPKRWTAYDLEEKIGLNFSTFSRWRDKALKKVATNLIEELQSAQDRSGRRKQALLDRYHNLSASAQMLLRLITVFQQPIPFNLLHRLSHKNGTASIQNNLDHLTSTNLLLSNEQRDNFLVHPELSHYILIQLSPSERQTWHQDVGRHYQQQQQYLEAARHFRQAGDLIMAATILVDHYREIVNDSVLWQQTDQSEVEGLRDLLAEFKRHDFKTEANLWANVKIIRGQVLESLQDIEAAIAEYRAALGAPDIQIKALAYYRRARALRFKNYDEALSHYGYGIKLLEQTHPVYRLLVRFYIGRAWIYIQERPDLKQAEADLRRAEVLVQADDRANWADLYNAWGDWYYWQDDLEQALQHRLEAWLAAEEVQDVGRMIRTSNNVGQDYAALEQYEKALDYLERSTALAQKAGDTKSEALGYKTIGACYFWLKQYQQAIRYYQQALEIFIQTKNPSWQASTYHDLAEGYAELGEIQLAQQHFQKGITLAKALGKTRVLDDLYKLIAKYPALDPLSELNERQHQILIYVKQQQQITNKTCRQLTGVSQKQATRDLKKLVDLGLLKVEGQGRATRYVMR